MPTSSSHPLPPPPKDPPHVANPKGQKTHHSPCYHRFVNVKTAKRLEKLAAEIGAAPTRTKRILVGLSLGTSSAALVDVLSDMLRGQLQKRPSASFDAVVVHVEDDTGSDEQSPSPSPSQELLDRYARRYPHSVFQRVPLSTALELDAIDWAALSLTSRQEDADDTTTTAEPAPARLRALLARLPSPTSRADVRRLLVRHVLLAAAAREGCRALVLGGSTTALAEVTLAETAKGRGFSLPWMVGDGPVVVRRPGGGGGGGARSGGREEDFAATGGGVAAEADGESKGTEAAAAATTRLSVYHPNRELFRGELERYAALVEPPLTELTAPAGEASGRGPGAAVVSHRDISIDEVMTRYFAEVEQNYPSIVANVVRTTAKLNRPGDEGEVCCGLCGMGLDELGDERWRGEIGDEGWGEDGRLCYGCSRAMRG